MQKSMVIFHFFGNQTKVFITVCIYDTYKVDKIFKGILCSSGLWRWDEMGRKMIQKEKEKGEIMLNEKF